MKENIDKALSFKADYPILENLLKNFYNVKDSSYSYRRKCNA